MHHILYGSPSVSAGLSVASKRKGRVLIEAAVEFTERLSVHRMVSFKKQAGTKEGNTQSEPWANSCHSSSAVRASRASGAQVGTILTLKMNVIAVLL